MPAIEDWRKELQGWGKPHCPRMVRSERIVGRGLSSVSAVSWARWCANWPPLFTEDGRLKSAPSVTHIFALNPGVNRANRLTFSHTCKQYRHNRRVERARQLYAEG